MNSTKSNLPIILIDVAAHRLAEKFASQQATPDKLKRVYFNTLAVYVVNQYLKQLEIPANLDRSDSWNPVLHSLFDVAELTLENIDKKIECRPVFPGETTFNLPLEGTENLIGYVVVQLNETLTQAEILGFLPINAISKNPVKQIAISDLKSVDVLIDHIYDAQEAISGQKLMNIIHLVQQAFKDVLEEPTLSYAHRSTSELRELSENHQDSENHLVVEIDLGLQKLLLIVEMAFKDEQRKLIRLQLESINTSELPPLQLYIIEETGEIFPHQIESENPNHLQFKTFNGRIGEHFSIKIVLGDVSVTENFIVA
ncbi:DUF1822 family protein [Nodularia spumigena]|uniref:DUF1822 family protein n=1 Tax=Nodularia spumigena TaxID=70799 RepID=UPI00232D0095|nr:DUF1822 family protein [Nodularia spumigena]MDB9316617.1 DUF1822 family protein [Nodularia spumigena CS-590/01A]MDB9326648.1 DUF1822 family protein [Nodularia spumigena CS-590/02]MDB9334145.1 DUF1822 family protein [Nodularia spumigena CS-590/01]MDB9347004.1 DUF1822 family protein [Nodularia spumigena CS-588/01]MDB9353989.1 DUF1822 family protein [Nodularia spumigena CS-588/05]